MWEINNSLQVLGFLRSAVLGGIFCLFYDLLRSIRRVTADSFTAVFFEDLLYFCVCAPVTFCFLLATTNGEMRSFVFAGIALGFIIIRLTVSKILLKLITAVLLFFSKIFNTANKAFYAFFGRICTVFERFKAFCGKKLKKALKLIKKLLKKQ